MGECFLTAILDSANSDYDNITLYSQPGPQWRHTAASEMVLLLLVALLRLSTTT